MISTSLPNIKTYNGTPSKLDNNAVIFANTTEKYFYPEHKTPYLFVTNFLNKGKYVLNKKHIEISDKHFYFLNVNDNLEIQFSKAVPLQTLIILFEENFLKDCINCIQTPEKELLDLPGNEPGSWFELPNVPFDFTKNIREKISLLIRRPWHKEDLDSLLFELIAEIAFLSNETLKQIKKIKSVKKSTQEELYKRLFLAKELMNDNVFHKVTIDQIAREVCLNKFHFLSNFKSLFNTTPHQYFIELKLQKAFHLLQDNRHSVTEVCYLVGFESIGSFSNLFKKRFKISPSTLTAQK